MENFRNILYVSYEGADETEALKKAIELSHKNKTLLNILVISPKLAGSLKDHEEAYKKSLIEKMGLSVHSSIGALKLSGSTPEFIVTVEFCSTPAINIIRRILQNEHDVVIKEAEYVEGKKGFKALDMELLRKCPCPVWLCRSGKRLHGKIRIAVAIDPQSHEPAGHDLSLKLLKLSRSLADNSGGKLDIVSCWFYEYEVSLKNNPWIKVSENELQKIVSETQSKHKNGLDALISESCIGGEIDIHHIKGQPENIIPSFLSDEKIDIVVMGTVARTGIYSFIIGNTAENILQKVECSLLAMKPNGFVSPVKAH